MTKAKITNPAYKHSIVVPESPQEAVFSAPTPEENPPQQAPEAQESTQEQEETTPPETETVPVRYRVSAPGGLHLRDGPGRAYRSLTVLQAGELVLGDDVADLLRADRDPGDSAWITVLSKAGSGWADGAYLERIADEPAQ